MAKSISIKTSLYRKVDENGKETIMFTKNKKYRPLAVNLNKEQADFFMRTIGVLNYSINAIGR